MKIFLRNTYGPLFLIIFLVQPFAATSNNPRPAFTAFIQPHNIILSLLQYKQQRVSRLSVTFFPKDVRFVSFIEVACF